MADTLSVLVEKRHPQSLDEYDSAEVMYRIREGMNGIKARQDDGMVQDERDNFFGGENFKKPLFHPVNHGKSCHPVEYLVYPVRRDERDES